MEIRFLNGLFFYEEKPGLWLSVLVYILLIRVNGLNEFHRKTRDNWIFGLSIMSIKL